MPAAAFKTALGNNFNNTSGTTLAITTTAAIAIGDLVVVRWASDNLSATTPTATCADGGNTYTVQRQAAANATAAAGIAGGLLTSVATVARASGSTITLTFSGAITGKAAYAESFTNATATTRVAIVGTTAASGTASSTGASAAGLVAGDLCLGFSAVQSRAAVTGDADTTNGSWSTIVHINGGGTSGQDATSVQINGQYKVVTATGAQTYDNTVTSTYWVNGLVILQQAPNPAITQAAYQFFDDAGTESGAVSLAAINTSIIGNTVNGDGLGVLRTRLQLTTAVATQATDDYQLQWEKNASGTWNNVVATALADSYSPGPSYSGLTFGAATATTAAGQSFLGNGGKLTQASLSVEKSGTPPGNVVAQLYAHTGTFGSTGTPTGSPLATSTTGPLCSSLPAFSGNGNWVSFTFDGTFTLVNGTAYFIVLTTTVVGDASNGVVFYGKSPGTHAGNSAGLTNGVWSASATDRLFQVYTTAGTVVPYDNPNLTDGAATTNRMGAGTGSFVAGKISETGDVPNFGWSASNFTELVYSLRLPQADFANNDVLRFRVLYNGATTLMTYTQTPLITVRTPVALAGESDGVSTASGDLTVTAAYVTGTRVLESAAGRFTEDAVARLLESAVVAGPVALAGQSDGTSTASGTLTVTRSLAAQADGVATVTSALVVAKALAGQSSGVGTTSASMVEAKALAGQSDGVSTVTASLVAARPLAGQSDGVSTVTSDLTVAKAPKLLAGQSDGVSTVTGSLSITKALAGESDGVATSTAAMVVAKALAGQSAGVATTTALLGVTRSLAGESDGVSTTTAALARARPLAGQSDGVSTVGSSSTAVIIANDPCDNFTTNSWTNASCSISASGHTGNAFSIPTGTGNNITKSIPGATATTTIGFWVNWSVIPGVTAAFLKFFSDSGSTEHIDIRIDGTHLQVFRPLSTQLALATSGIVVNTWYYMEVQVTLSDTVGAVVVNVNGTPVISVSGVDTHNPGGTVIDTVQFSGMGSTGTWLVDEIYLRTDATFGAGLAAGVPLSVARALASESDGVSTVASDLTVTHVAAPWAGQSDGTGTAAGTLTVVRSLAGESDGVATTTAAMVVAKALAGESDGVSTVTAALARARSLAGQADGVATVTGALGMTKALAGQSNGVATDSAALTLALSLAGRSDGVGTAPNAPLALLKALSGQSDGLGGASATTLIRVRGLLAQSDGVATVTGAMSLALALAGRSDGASTFTGYFAQAGQVVLGGRSDGVATVSASLSVVRPLAGQSAGVSTVTAALIRARPLAAQSDGVSTTSAGVLVLRGLNAVAAGASTVQGSLNRTVPFVGQSVGVATTVAQLGLDRLLVGRSDGVGDASSDLVVLRFLAGQSDGMSTTVAVLIRDVPLTGQSDGLSTVTALLDIMAMGAIINVWTGSTWRRQTTVTPPILVWNGATWKDDANVWDGEQWQPLNPVG